MSDTSPKFPCKHVKENRWQCKDFWQCLDCFHFFFGSKEFDPKEDIYGIPSNKIYVRSFVKKY